MSHRELKTPVQVEDDLPFLIFPEGRNASCGGWSCCNPFESTVILKFFDNGFNVEAPNRALCLAGADNTVWPGGHAQDFSSEGNVWGVRVQMKDDSGATIPMLPLTIYPKELIR